MATQRQQPITYAPDARTTLFQRLQIEPAYSLAQTRNQIVPFLHSNQLAWTGIQKDQTTLTNRGTINKTITTHRPTMPRIRAGLYQGQLRRRRLPQGLVGRRSTRRRRPASARGGSIFTGLAKGIGWGVNQRARGVSSIFGGGATVPNPRQALERIHKLITTSSHPSHMLGGIHTVLSKIRVKGKVPVRLQKTLRQITSLKQRLAGTSARGGGIFSFLMPVANLIRKIIL